MKSIIGLFFSVIFLLFISCKDNTNAKQIVDSSSESIINKNPAFSVNKENNITYGKGLSHTTWNSVESKPLDLKLDVYLPENNLKKRPVIVLFHGGGFRAGSRKDPNLVAFSNYFSSRGWVVFSVDYRLKGDKGTIPTSWVTYASNNSTTIKKPEDLYRIYPAIRDAKAALRWVVANAEKYNIDTERITVGGSSAGAIIATTLGISNLEDYTNEIPSYMDATLASTHLKDSYSISAILNLWGSGDGISVLDSIYGYKRFNNKVPPMLIVHGKNDTILPIEKAEELKKIYKARQVNLSYYPFLDFGHGVWEGKRDGKTIAALSLDFIVEQQNLVVADK